jgi:electron transfer flavoprotein alpha subunit
MPGIVINPDKCSLCGKCITICPFGAIELKGKKPEINSACKACRICFKSCPFGAISLTEEKPVVDLSDWRDILVFGEINPEGIHPVTFELICKGLELAGKAGYNLHVVVIGDRASEMSGELENTGVKSIIVYDNPCYRHFNCDLYADAFADAIRHIKPSVVLVGGTAVGRSLAPRLSTRFKTGLTADCTRLEITEKGELIQIRPAFGGEIMARIITPNTRPQFATVRYKTMDRYPLCDGRAEIIIRNPPTLRSRITMLKEEEKPAIESITDADIIVAGGRGLKSVKDFALLEGLAKKLGGQVAGTRPVIEAGWLPYTRQIGLSGRTVKPKLIITCGISGAVQFTAAMQNSGLIIAINKDAAAPIFNIAHYGFVGDLYEIIPLLEKAL